MDTMRTVLLIFVVVFLFAACPSPVQQEEATLTLYFGAIEARAVFPPDAATLAKLEHTITLVGPGETITRTFGPGITTANIEITTGTWKISVVAFLVEGSEKVLYAVGSKTVTITEGINNVTVKMYGDESSEGFTFEVIDDDGPNKGTARVRGNGLLEGDIIIPSYYKDGEKFLPVTEIGSRTFNYYGTTSVTIPANVTYIGREAFSNCTSLETVNFVEGSRLESIDSYAFSGCTGLGAITIPAGVTNIYWGAFSYCNKLTNVTFAAGSKLEAIYTNAFSYCTNLTSITIPAGVKRYTDDYYPGIADNPFIGCIKLATITVEAGNQDFSSEGGILYNKDKTELLAYPTAPANFTIPASITNIGWYAFSNCENLTSVTIPGNVKYISNSAFSNCGNLTSVSLTTGLETIGNNAFSYCPKLTGITLPEGLWTIDGWAFAFTDLKTIAIPASVEYIIENPFVGCDNLATITVDPSNTNFEIIGGILYQKIYSDPPNNTDFTSHFLLSYPTATGIITNLPSTLTRIRYDAFYGTAITEITLPATIMIIEDGAFTNCDNLISITIPESIRRIGGSAFYNCTSLAGDIVLPTGLETIYDQAFSGCRRINSITIPASVKEIGWYAFSGWTSSQTINVLGKANQADADDAWKVSDYTWTDEDGRIYNWRYGCEAKINYIP